MAVLKADAYGHGAVRIAKVALENGADWLGVAIVEEGVELRRANIKAPTLVLGLTSPGEVPALLSYNLTPTVCSLDDVAMVSAEAERIGRIANVHIKIDTGMGRIGLLPGEAPDFIRRVAELKNLRIEGLCTHLSSAEEEDGGFTRGQIEDFRSLIGRLAEMGINIPLKHAANSAGLLNYPDSHLDMVRPGLIIYGLHPSDGTSRAIDLKPAMSFKTRVSYLKKVRPGRAISYGRTFVTERETLVATLPVGYADGYSRSLSNCGEVLIGGRRAPIIGRVCMDMCLADVSSVPGVGLRDEVVLMGKQGGEEITADDLAAKLKTINYEVVCSIGKRVPRVYL
jgi:alanine racemase